MQKIIHYEEILPKVERLNLLLLTLLVSLQYNGIDIKVLQLSKAYFKETLMKTKRPQEPILCRVSLPNLSGSEFLYEHQQKLAMMFNSTNRAAAITSTLIQLLTLLFKGTPSHKCSRLYTTFYIYIFALLLITKTVK